MDDQRARPLTEEERRLVLVHLEKYGKSQATVQSQTQQTQIVFDPIDNVSTNPVKSDDLIPDSGYSNPTVRYIRYVLLPFMYAKIGVDEDAIKQCLIDIGLEYEETTNGDIKFTIFDAMPLSTLHVFYNNNRVNFFMFT